MTLFLFYSDGMGRTGTFISVHAQQDRLKTEGVIDVFHYIKSIRIQRPGLVANLVSPGTIKFRCRLYIIMCLFGLHTKLNQITNNYCMYMYNPITVYMIIMLLNDYYLNLYFFIAGPVHFLSSNFN